MPDKRAQVQSAGPGRLGVAAADPSDSQSTRGAVIRGILGRFARLRMMFGASRQGLHVS
jgi:hypothetical protein